MSSLTRHSATPGGPPRLDGERLALPGRLWVRAAARRPNAPWLLENAAGHKLRELTALGYGPEEGAELLTDLRDPQITTAEDWRVLRYAGYVIDGLYLREQEGSGPPGKQTLTRAAQLSRLLLRVLEERGEPEDEPPFALAMLRRGWWLALHMLLATAGEDEAQGIRREHGQALRAWQAVCVGPGHSAFFADWLAPWVGANERPWQQVREDEAERTIWEGDGRLLVLEGVSQQRERMRLEMLIRKWYLPRYRFKGARRLRLAVADLAGEGGGWLKSQLLGMGPMFAAAGIGLIATMLQGDTWDLLLSRAGEPLGVLIGIAFGLACWALLRYDATQRAGSHILSGVFALFWRAELLALVLAVGCALLFGQQLHDEEAGLVQWVVAVAIYAQMALFLGVFTHIILPKLSIAVPGSISSE